MAREEGAVAGLHFMIAPGDTFLIEPAMVQYNIRIGLVARICRSQSSQDDQFRQGRGSIPRFGIILLRFEWNSAVVRPFFLDTTSVESSAILIGAKEVTLDVTTLMIMKLSIFGD